jgi:hypothetical protein
MTVRFLLQLEPQAWWNPPRASSPTSLVVRGQSTWGRRTLRIHPRSRNVIWAKRARCYPAYSLRGEWFTKALSLCRLATNGRRVYWVPSRIIRRLGDEQLHTPPSD